MQSHQIWLLSPYHTGSHRAWAEGYHRHSRHQIRLLTLPGRFWKWRMQGGAIELASLARHLLQTHERPDVILATDMLNLTAWLGLLRSDLPASIPTLLYMHENQLTYPPRPGESPDLTYAMINWISQLAATHTLFNSHFHRASWFDELPRLLKQFPDYSNLQDIESVYTRSHVLPVGIDCTPFPLRVETVQSPQPPLIVWNQRWEYDKRPDRFFALLYRLHNDGVRFRLAVAGKISAMPRRNLQRHTRGWPITLCTGASCATRPIINGFWARLIW